MVDIHEQDTFYGVRAYMVKMCFAGGDVHFSMILYELMKMVSKQPHV
jgi:hypothetical protein